MPIMRDMERDLTIMEVAMQVKEASREDDLAIFFLIAWGFWFRINKIGNDKVCIEPRQVTEHALSLQRMHTNIKSLPNTKTKTYTDIKDFLN